LKLLWCGAEVSQTPVSGEVFIIHDKLSLPVSTKFQASGINCTPLLQLLLPNSIVTAGIAAHQFYRLLK
jgi:hypothetical protein